MTNQGNPITNQYKIRLLNLYIWKNQRELNDMPIEDHRAKFIRERIYLATGYLLSISLIKKQLKINGF